MCGASMTSLANGSCCPGPAGNEDVPRRQQPPGPQWSYEISDRRRRSGGRSRDASAAIAEASRGAREGQDPGGFAPGGQLPRHRRSRFAGSRPAPDACYDRQLPVPREIRESVAASPRPSSARHDQGAGNLVHEANAVLPASGIEKRHVEFGVEADERKIADEVAEGLKGRAEWLAVGVAGRRRSRCRDSRGRWAASSLRPASCIGTGRAPAAGFVRIALPDPRRPDTISCHEALRRTRREAVRGGILAKHRSQGDIPDRSGAVDDRLAGPQAAAPTAAWPRRSTCSQARTARTPPRSRRPAASPSS
jgi:hypothetical protein